MAKRNEMIEYNLQEVFGILKEYSEHNWAKSVCRIIWGDNPPTVDIRQMNMALNRVGKGISLSNEETDSLVNILLDKGYGDLDKLEDAIRKRKSIYSDDIDNEDQYFRIKFGK